jgi:hypothetical protein
MLRAEKDLGEKKLQVSNSIKIRYVGADLFHGGVWTDRLSTDRHDEANGRFSQFFRTRLLYFFSVLEVVLFLRIVLNKGIMLEKNI